MKELFINKIRRGNNKKINLKISKIPFSLNINNKNIIKKSPKYKSNNKIKSVVYKRNSIQKMNWKQLKKRFPGMSPTADADFDGLVNSRDCRPLDPSKDGVFSRVLGIVTGGRAGQTKEEYGTEREEKKERKVAGRLAKKIALREEARPIIQRRVERIKRKKGFISEAKREGLIKRQEIIENLKRKFKSRMAEKIEKKIKEITPTTKKEFAKVRVKRKRIVVEQVEKFAGVYEAKKEKGKTAPGKRLVGAGRPSQSFKYKDPRTGQPIPAIQYHRLMKKLKGQAKTLETQTEVRQRFALAKRGLSPEEVAMEQERINQRMAQLRALKAIKRGEVPEGGEGVPEEVGEEEVVEPTQEAVVEQPRQVIQQAPLPQPQRLQRVEPMTAVPGSYGIPPGYRLQEDLMTGRKRLVPLPPREAWTR